MTYRSCRCGGGSATLDYTTPVQRLSREGLSDTVLLTSGPSFTDGEQDGMSRHQDHARLSSCTRSAVRAGRLC